MAGIFVDHPVLYKLQTFQGMKVNCNKKQYGSMAWHQTRDLGVRVQIPVQVQIFLLKLNLIITYHQLTDTHPSINW